MTKQGTVKSRISGLGLIIFFISLTLFPAAVWAIDPVKIGILAFRPKQQTLKQWQPLAIELKRHIPERDFIIEAFTYSELQTAVASRQLDFVLTNPGHYILLARRFGLSAPLATLAVNNNDHVITVFGGVIFSRSELTNINTLDDIKGKTIATTSTESLGGYQMQAYELRQKGIWLPQDAKIITTDMPHDNVIEAVLSGKAEIGFIRSGVLEEMSQEHKLDMERIKILNRQNLPNYPVQVSTQLYPEWPFAALPHIEEKLARHVAAALFLLEKNTAITNTIGIQGFVVPADYTPISDLLKELHLPPFDISPKFTLRDIWESYRWEITIGLIATGLIFLLGFRLLIIKQKLELAHNKLLSEQRKLLENERRHAEILESVDACIYLKDKEFRYLFANRPVRELFGTSIDKIIGQKDELFFDSVTIDNLRKNDRRVLEHGETVRTEETNHGLTDNLIHTYLSVKLPLRDEYGEIYALCGISTDITDRKQAEEKLQLAAKVFSHAREGIMITSADGTIIDVNNALIEMTGFQRHEILGKNPRIFSSGLQSKQFFTEMWSSLANVGYWYGEIWNRRKDGAVYAAMLTISSVSDIQQKIQHYVALFSDITSLKEHEKQLEHIAHYDALTNLPNRVLLADRLRQAISQAVRREKRLAVAFIDLDGFKAINDRYGHNVGDQLLMTIASRMKQSLREGDTLARLGGDEFIAVLHDLADIESSVPLLNRLLTAASQTVNHGNLTLQVSASLGVTFYPQVEEIDADQLLRQADQAMYQAKLAGKNRYHLFDAAQDQSIRAHRDHLEHIRQALINREFVLHYQPKVNMRTGELIGVEALIRWQNPDQGLLLPAAFLPIVENHPLSIELGEWVIDTALTQIEQWHDVGLNIRVSVNVNAIQLQQANFVDRLQSLLAAHPKVKMGDLEMEVLETSALEDLEQISQVINTSKEIGVNFALDDFGTGYSSLTYLKHLPVTQLKVDQSFVRDMLEDPDDLAIVRGVFSLATAFYRQVVAEGVETTEHGKMLLQLGCELAQGFGIAKPMPAEDLDWWLQTWKPDPLWASLPLLDQNDLSVTHAALEHRIWLSDINDYLHRKTDSIPALSPDQCRFGLWLNLSSHKSLELNDIDTLHRQIHQQAAALCALCANGDRSSAIAGLDDLYQLRDKLFNELENLLARKVKTVSTHF